MESQADKTLDGYEHQSRDCWIPLERKEKDVVKGISRRNTQKFKALSFNNTLTDALVCLFDFVGGHSWMCSRLLLVMSSGIIPGDSQESIYGVGD